MLVVNITESVTPAPAAGAGDAGLWGLETTAWNLIKEDYMPEENY